MDPARLPLRDVHLPDPPGWWPPSRGWWWRAAAWLVVVALVAAWRQWRRARRRRWLRLFDECTAAADPAQAIAQMSALLRRAARHHRPGAELLRGEAWLHFLDGNAGTDFSAGAGHLLLEGGFRPQVPPDAVEAARELARARFLQLMEAGR